MLGLRGKTQFMIHCGNYSENGLYKLLQGKKFLTN